MITDDEKLKAVQRELRYRRWVYPKRVAAGSMKQQEAEKQIAVFEAIEADYQKAVASGRLL